MVLIVPAPSTQRLLGGSAKNVDRTKLLGLCLRRDAKTATADNEELGAAVVDELGLRVREHGELKSDPAA